MQNLTAKIKQLHDWQDLYLNIASKSNDYDLEGYQEQLKIYRERDLLTQRSNFGCHKMDLIVKRNNISSAYLSTGQLKSALIQVIVAHYNLLSDCRVSPILLLDDIFSHFDNEVKDRIVSLITSNANNQFWITTTGCDAFQNARIITL